jgi:hypothetical protein
MIFRPGRKNARALYLQSGEVPADGDLCVGMVDSGPLAEFLAGLGTERLLADRRAATRQIEAFALAPRCIACGGLAVWHTGEPTMQQPGWRHIDWSISRSVGGHRPVFGLR